MKGALVLLSVAASMLAPISRTLAQGANYCDPERAAASVALASLLRIFSTYRRSTSGDDAELLFGLELSPSWSF
jgi:hypothetical protein